MTRKLSALIESFKHQLESGDRIDPDAAREMLLAISIDTHQEVKLINGRLKKVEGEVEDLKKAPSFLRYLHQNPKRTITILVSSVVVTFVLLSLLWDYKLLSILIEWLGLPPILLN